MSQGGTAVEIVFQERHGVPFYACTDPRWCGAPHGFSTRLGGVSPAPWDSLNLGAGRGTTPPGWGRTSAASAGLWVPTQMLW